MRIETTNTSLELDMMQYGLALLTQYCYMNSFRDYDEKVNGVIRSVYLITEEESKLPVKPIFHMTNDTEFSPDLSEIEINSLKDPDLFTKEELLAMVNTLLLEKLSKEIEEYERLNGCGDDNATVSDTELQGWRDTHKEEELREIQCLEEKNR